MARNRLVWLVCLAILSVLPAGATFQTYTTLEAWEAAATQSGVTIDFSSLGLAQGYSSSYMQSLLISTVTFTSPPDLSFLVTNPWEGQQDYWGTGAILRGTHTYPLKVTLATPVTAFAALMGIGGVANQMDVKVYGSDGAEIGAGWVAPTSAQPAPTFFGIVSTDGSEPFKSITFTPVERFQRPFLDDVRLGAYKLPPPPPPPPPDPPPSSDTPEMGTGVLSLCGGILLAAGGFRKHLKA